jgi:acetyl/propionyl-CoA carboxylase alpha subunit/acetyl-CoA carboxylase carboxyltransferase component
MTPIRRLAIVNRGEPAIRALAAVAELNASGALPPITTIAVHTDPDAGAWYVREADEALSLGPATYLDPADGQRKSRYLDEAQVVARLRQARVDAVWVGWGFVAEHPSFAQRCERSGIVFVGPDSATIRRLGDKVSAKRVAEEARVPVVPWSGGPVADVAAAAASGQLLGYPVVLKAAAGGGGRGIRVVREPAQLAAAFAAARNEARLAFGDPTVFLETLVAAARHVEVQVIADGQGGIWALGVRDCSIQRRHQKVIEESASTALDPAAEAGIEDAAVRLMSAAGYRGAGTVEFLVDPRTGRYYFLEVNARLQVEHPVTEATTGVDLVKLQLHVAGGGRLTGRPAPRGHAVEARLCAEDPEQSFAPAPGRLAVLTLPSGAGIRVDTGVREGDLIAPEFDSMIAKIIAYGRDRDEALTRLRRALAQTTVVVEGGTTNRAFLLALLDHPDVRSGHVDNQWLDRLTAAGGHVPPADPVALLVAAVEAYQADDEAERAAFHARAARGRPDVPRQAGHACLLRYRGIRYPLRVFRTGPTTYRVDARGQLADIGLEAVNGYERRVVVGGVRHRVLAVTDGSTFRLEVDGAAHSVVRDDGGVVRSGWPAFVVSVLVKPGDQVAEGDPLVVLESMKMEASVVAPVAGEVVEVAVAANAQVDAGAPLLRIRASAAGPSANVGTPLDLRGLVAAEPVGTPACERVYGALKSYLLGYDLDPASLRGLLTRQRRLGQAAPPADPGLMACEDGLLDLFADVGSLFRPRSGLDPVDGLAGDAPQEYLLSYLQWLDADRAGLPERYRERLETALRRYGVPGLARTPELQEAVVWMFRSFSRVHELVPAVAGILERRLRHRAELATPPQARTELRARLDRLAAATQGRHQVIADLARDVRFRYLDEPLLTAVVEEEYATVDAHLAALRAEPDSAQRAARVDQLVRSPQPLRGTLLRHWLDGGDDPFRDVLLEVYTRRHYRIQQLGALTHARVGRYRLCAAEYDEADRRVHLVTLYAPLAELADVSRAVATHLAQAATADREVVVDLTTWRPGEAPDIDALASEVEDLLSGCAFDRPLWRLNLTVTSAEGALAEHLRTQHLTYHHPSEGKFVEEPLYRNLHPMLAERLDLWRLSNFTLTRLASAEDVYLFSGVARDNPADRRLFALAEVRDMTAVTDSSAAVSYPRLELTGLLALSAMRQALASFSDRERPTANRIVLYVHPLWTVARRDWARLARSFAPLAVGADLQKVVLRVRIPAQSQPGAAGPTQSEPGAAEPREALLHIEGLGRHGVTVRERPPGQDPVRPLTAYRQKVLKAQRFGAPYPYELVRMLAPPPGTLGRFPAGRFAEYDLDEAGDLVPVSRRPGLNTANVVVGLLTNHTATVPEGMTRVALLGDPTRGLGNLAEAECRRIIAALDLAERMGLPVEWFALSSGARIAMDSGTENMDWIAAVLRRLVGFTQAGGEVNVVVTGVNVGAQPYWNAEATMLMHTRGILVMTPNSAMVLTGKQALDFSGGVSAEDNFGIGGYDRVMGPNGQGQYWAPTLEDACDILLRHYDHTYVVPGERYPRRAPTADPRGRDVCRSPHPGEVGDLRLVGDVFSAQGNPERKKPFDIRAVLRSVTDADSQPLERWGHWRGAETAVVWDAHIGGIPVCLLGLESRTVPRRGFVPADGPPAWTSGTLFPQSSRKTARAINAASGNRPVVVLANLSGFDGSPESLRRWQLEYGAEIGRAVTNFRGPIVFVVISRYHGGAFVVFSKRLNERMEIAAVEGSYASVIGGAPAAATVFAREVKARTEQDPRVAELQRQLRGAAPEAAAALRARLAEVVAEVRAEKLGAVADEFDSVHSIQRALAVGSVDRIIAARELRPYLIGALERGMAADLAPDGHADGPMPPGSSATGGEPASRAATVSR